MPNFRPAAILLLLCLVARGETAPARYIVVSVRGTEAWTRGDLVSPGVALQLPADSELKLMAPDDRVVLLRGPFSGSLRESSSSQGVLYDVLVRLRGVIRNITPRGERSEHAGDPTIVDTTTSGDKCVRPEPSVLLWKPQSEKKAVALLRMKRGPSEEIEWPVRETTVAWPSTVPLKNERNYSMHFIESGETRSLRVHFVPSNITDDKELAVWMASQRCHGQLFALVERFPANE